MIELKDNELKFKFPNIHSKASCNINFQRTLRIPDDNNEYPLPPGLGKFPLHHVDDYAKILPNKWKKHGGVFDQFTGATITPRAVVAAVLKALRYAEAEKDALFAADRQDAGVE